MIEIITIFIHAIVTDQAIRPKGQDMRLGEDNIHLTVAGLAGVGIEGRYIPMMTIAAGKRFARDFELMSL